MAFLVSKDNQEKFAIPNGETVIGRGPYLRVKEQILSRSHAVVSLHNGKVCIKPTHRNPTYFYSSDSVENCVSLEKDKWKELADGDSVSLLSGSYKYCIEISNTSNGSPLKSNSDKLVTIEENKHDTLEKSVEKDVLTNQEVTQDINLSGLTNTIETSLYNEDVCQKKMFVETLATEEDKGLPNTVDETMATEKHRKGLPNTACETSKDGTPKKRKLPNWMVETTKSSAKKKKVVHRKPLETEQPGHTEQDTSAPKEQDVCLPKVTSPIKSLLKCDISLQQSVESKEKGISTCNPEPPDTNQYPAKGMPQIETSPIHEPPDTNQYPAKGMPQIETSPIHEACYEFPIKHNSQDELSLVSQVTTDISEVEHTVKNTLGGNISDSEKTVTKSPIAGDDEHVVTKSSTTGEQSNDSVMANQSNENGDGEENMKSREASFNSSEGEETKDIMKLCPYGKNCYRKNPAHFVEYSHSTKHGDDDDNGDNGDDDDDNDGNKRDCPYGLKCYRQNNPHHVERFNHTGRKTRKKRKTKGKSLLDKEIDNDGDNEYDLDDSFLASTDDSGGYSDNSDDSDYKPDGHISNDDEDEDVGELVSEAKDFIKNKKM